MKINSKSSFSGHLRGLLYKSNIYYIDYLLADSSVVTYRYQKSTATDGLYVSPVVDNFDELSLFWEGRLSGQRPLAIRVRNEHPYCEKENVEMLFIVETPYSSDAFNGKPHEQRFVTVLFDKSASSQQCFVVGVAPHEVAEQH